MPRIVEADKEKQIAGVILLAGNTRSLPDVLDYQIPYLLGLDGSISDDDQKKIDEQKEVTKNIRDLEYLKAMPDGEMLMGAPKNYYLDLHGYAPAKEAASVFSKALILQGERDYQVTMKDDFATWKSELSSKEGVTFKSYPKLNHLFIVGRGKSKPIEYQRPGHVAAEVVDDIANWTSQ